jgi:hypothetical protein
MILYKDVMIILNVNWLIEKKEKNFPLERMIQVEDQINLYNKTRIVCVTPYVLLTLNTLYVQCNKVDQQWVTSWISTQLPVISTQLDLPRRGSNPLH